MTAPELLLARALWGPVWTAFASRKCRTVAAFDAHAKFHPDAYVLGLTHGDAMSALDLLMPDLRHRSDAIQAAVVRGTRPDGDVRDTLVVYRTRNLQLFTHHMWYAGFDTQRAPDAGLLSLVGTWDRERPFLEELIVMGLFGDFAPCHSMIPSDRASEYVDSLVRDTKVTRADEQGMDADRRARHRGEVRARFVQAYNLFVREALS